MAPWSHNARDTPTGRMWHVLTVSICLASCTALLCLFYSTDADAKATREATEKEIRQQEYDEVSMRKR